MPYQRPELRRPAATAPETRFSPVTARSPAAIFVHDLFYLTQECAQRKPAFRQLKLTADTLGRYGAGLRYPMEDFVDPDEEEPWEALKLAGEVVTFVKGHL
ncbi:MAG: hypothetical protein OXF54_17490 [Caldilineaceae bacterium]|nr:hypothetical protein [Caldilineaceae bacterium]MCY4082041.1 hypothetical protein [Caldilineaceae bacterium]